MKILFLSRWFPFPVNNGSKLRIHNLLRGLGKHHEVTLLSFADQPAVNTNLPELQNLCSAVHTIPWREYNPSSPRARRGFLSLKPRSLIDTFSPEMAQKIQNLLSECHYDLVIASQLSMAAYRPYFKGIPALFEEVEIGLFQGDAFYSSGLRKRIRRAFTWLKLRIFLSALLNSFQACSVVSEDERRLILRYFPKCKSMIEVIPNCLLVDDYKGRQAVLAANQMIFSGSFRYHANYEAMLWYVQEVHPLVLEQVPDAYLVITGDHADQPFPAVPNVSLAGYVDDIKKLVASSWVSVAPLLSGGGTRLKILEAMALGTPVVSTSKGAEGLDVTNGQHIFVADRPLDFADKVVRILKDRDLRDRIANDAHELVKEKYDWDAVMPCLLSFAEITARKS